MNLWLSMGNNTRRRILRLLVSALVIYATVDGIGATPAKAHASLIGSVPAYEATLTEAPETIELLFDNLVEPGLVKVRLKDGNDVEVGKGALIGDKSPRNEVKFTLPAHGEGSYLITWVSFAYDGHIVSGTIPYTVDLDGATNTPGITDTPNTLDTPANTLDTPANTLDTPANTLDTPGTPAEEGTTGDGSAPMVNISGTTNRIIDIAEIQARFLSYIGFAALFGALLWRWAIGRRIGEPIVASAKDALERCLHTEGRDATPEATTAGVRAPEEAVPEPAAETFKPLDAKTKFSEIVNGAYSLGVWLTILTLAARSCVSAWRLIDGGYDGIETIEQIWSGQVGGYLAAAIILAWIAIRARNNAVVFAGGTVAAALSAGLGHSASEPAPGVNTVMMAIHIVAASTWVGGVGVLGYVATDGAFQKIADRWNQLREAVSNASSVFIAAAVALTLTGIRSAYVYSDGIPSGRWGLMLAAKLAFAGGAALIGMYHYQRSKRGEGTAKATLIIEAGLLVLTLTAAAVLSTTVVG
jgi:copper transport protein